MTVKKSNTKQPALPKAIKKMDLKKVAFRSKDRITEKQREESGLGWREAFDMWYVDGDGFGWCIPTLLISHNRRSEHGSRTYATTLEGKQVRIGGGPHVQMKIVVHLKKSNYKRLQPILKLISEGKISANQTRDQISTRRMRRYVGW